MPAVPYKDEMNYNHQAKRCAEGMENGEPVASAPGRGGVPGILGPPLRGCPRPVNLPRVLLRPREGRSLDGDLTRAPWV